MSEIGIADKVNGFGAIAKTAAPGLFCEIVSYEAEGQRIIARNCESLLK